MEAEAEEESVFEITDFTNATPWESFVAAIENTLYQWELASSTNTEGDSTDSSFKQHYKAERVSYVKWRFVMSYNVSTSSSTGSKPAATANRQSEDWPSGMQQFMQTTDDFPPKAHHISRWYGLDQFILISPDEHSDALLSEAQTKLLLSSVSLAISNTQCSTPVFIQVQKNWRHMYVGVCEGRGLRTNFSMIHLRTTPPHLNHLSGLLELFKSKLRSPILKPNPVEVTARFTYVLRHWSVDEWPVEPLGDVDGLLTATSFSTLPVGASSDPVQELDVSAVWPHLSEETVIDNASQSDFNPWHAMRWTVRTRLADNPSLLLYGLLDGTLRVCYRQESVMDLLGTKLLHDEGTGVASSDYAHALTKLTEPSLPTASSPIFSSVVYSATQRLEFGYDDVRPISEQELECVLQYIFPDSRTKLTTPTKRNPTSVDSKPSNKKTPLSPCENLLDQLKSAPEGSYTARLAKALSVVNQEYGIRAYAHIWFEVLLELRYRWEQGIIIEGLNCDAPDMRCCLLHQKLQMLNCCIRHKLSHGQQQQHSQSPTASGAGDTTIFHTPTSSLSFSQRHRDTAMEDSQHGGGPMTEDGHSSTSSDEFYEAQESIQTDTDTSLTRTDSHTTNQPDVTSSLRSQRSCDSSGSPSIRPRTADLQPVAGGNDPLSLLGREEEGEDTGVRDQEEAECTERSGALRPYKDLVLIATNEPMYEPAVQEPTPMTEDMLWEQQDVLSRLGTSQEAAHVRAKMQSLSLLSDMQAFKAANPGCLLEDFIRWYSPRDWITEEEEGEDSGALEESSGDGWDTGWAEGDDAMLERDSEPDPKRTRYVEGHLSRRMRQPDNMWVSSWEDTRPLSIHRQKKLFDDTKEAEKVLHHLAGLTPGELTVMLLPVLLHCAVTALQRRLKAWPLSAVESILHDALSMLCTVHRPSLDSLPVYQECLTMLQQAERILATALSLQLKLKQGVEFSGQQWEGPGGGGREVNTCIELLLDSDELVIETPSTSHIGKALRGLLVAHQDLQGSGSFPPPAGREFILRTTLPRPNGFSRLTPQRLFCVLTRDEMRLAGAFSEDTVLT